MFLTVWSNDCDSAAQGTKQASSSPVASVLVVFLVWSTCAFETSNAATVRLCFRIATCIFYFLYACDVATCRTLESPLHKVVAKSSPALSKPLIVCVGFTCHNVTRFWSLSLLLCYSFALARSYSSKVEILWNMARMFTQRCRLL